MIIKELIDKGLSTAPKWLATGTHYVTIMGSVAYGVSSDTSDCDLYGFAIPSKEDVFPHLRGEILDFGTHAKRFQQHQEHHVFDKDAMGGSGRTYDIQIFSIVKLFALAMECNPNIIDCLFTPVNCVLHCTAVGNMVRDNRRLFLHKGALAKFRGYANSQLHKIATKEPNGKRRELVERHGYDTKFAYHVVRLMDECAQILALGDIDLQRDREELKAIRRGDWTEKYLREVFADRDRHLDELAAKSKLPEKPPEAKIRQLLLDCLEHHYGSLDKCVVNPDKAITVLRNIREQLDSVSYLL